MAKLSVLQKKTKRFTREDAWGLSLASLPIIGFLLFGVIPLVFSLYMSFCSTDGFLIANMELLKNPFANYGTVLSDPLFWKSVVNTLYSLLSLPLTIILSLVLSVLLANRLVRAKKLFRTLFFLPYVCSIVALTTMWRTVMLNGDFGILNGFLGLFGINGPDWLTDPVWFMPAMIIMGVWQSLGFNIILFSAALTNVNEAVYEAASLDGANAFEKFFKITLPAISPTTFYVLVTGLISGLQEFTRFQAINGVSSNLISPTGPDNAGLTIVFYLYNYGFNTTAGMGIAAATSWLLCIVIALITVLNFKLSSKWVHYD